MKLTFVIDNIEKKVPETILACPFKSVNKYDNHGLKSALFWRIWICIWNCKIFNKQVIIPLMFTVYHCCVQHTIWKPGLLLYKRVKCKWDIARNFLRILIKPMEYPIQGKINISFINTILNQPTLTEIFRISFFIFINVICFTFCLDEA